jgi:hypothetical protein
MHDASLVTYNHFIYLVTHNYFISFIIQPKLKNQTNIWSQNSIQTLKKLNLG